MTERPNIPPKVKIFMEIFEKMGVTFVDNDDNRITADGEIEKKSKTTDISIVKEKRGTK